MNNPLLIEESPIRAAYFGRIKVAPVLVACSWLLMLMVGTDVINASLLAAAAAFGLLSVDAAGGIKSAPGLLNFILILKFLLIAMVLKIVTLQPMDSYLQAPRTTCEVMAVGFFAVYLGSLIYRYSIKIKGLVADVSDSRMYLWLTVVFAVACLGSSFVILVFQVSYTTNLTGGFWGVAHQFEGAESFCVIPALYYAWSTGSRRFLSHPLVLSILFAQLAYGIASTTKQGMMEPLLCYLGVGFIRYGIRSKAVWGIVAVGGFIYLTLVYPYSQYVRSHGGRDGTLKERLEVIQEVFLNLATNDEFRQSVDSKITTGETYLGKDAFRPISRLAMIGEADRLIAATDATQSYTGWDTIVNGFKLMVPSFLMPDKPTSGGGNFLGHIAGDLAPDDVDTQVSYGFMANLFNAFGLPGVLFGTIIFTVCFFYMLRLWFAHLSLSLEPWGSSIWYVLIGTLFEHSLIEAPIGNLLPAFINLSAIVALIFVSRFLFSFFAHRTSPGR